MPEHTIPYIFSITKESRVLTYFGAEHQTDIKHPQFDLLKNEFGKFMSPHMNKIVFTEGGVGKSYDNIVTATSHEGEAGFISFLAAQHSVPIFSPEPPSDYEIGELLKKFSEIEIVYYYLARVIAQFYGQNGVNDLGAYVDQIVKNDLSSPHFSKIYSFKDINDLHQKLFTFSLDLSDNEFFANVSNPLLSQSIVNRVAEESGYIRDYFIIDKISEHWRLGFSIFIVYGYTHAVMQENCIRETLGK